MDGAQIYQCARSGGIELNRFLVSFHGIGDWRVGFLEFESPLEPQLGLLLVNRLAIRFGGLWERPDGAQLSSIEIEQHLAADRLHLLSGDVDRDRAAVRDDFQFGKRGGYIGQPPLQRNKRATDLL